jgi:hypothetical protein
MLRRTAILAIAFAAATTAHAFPTGETLIVTAYYSDVSKTQLVGQRWSGCGQPSGSWGTTTPHRSLFFPAC